MFRTRAQYTNREGFRATLTWRGNRIETLKDVTPQPNGILLIGINPSPRSVEAGHYYQGRLGKRLWARLAAIDLLKDASPGAEDEAFARAGNGLTDIVKRPTRSAKDLGREEMKIGAASLEVKIRRWKPGLILFSYREPAMWLIDKGVRPGLCGKVEGVQAFLLSGPYALSEQATRINNELVNLIKTKQEWTRADVQEGKGPGEEAITLAVLDDRGPTSRPHSFRTQRVTPVDIRSGRIRLPRDTKRFFLPTRGHVVIVLRGERLEVPYDPRTGPDCERSAVLSIRREELQCLVRADEILSVSAGAKGIVHID